MGHGAGGIEVTGAAALGRAFTGMIASLNAATRTATTHAAHLLEREIKAELAKTSHPRGTPTPSNPGDPPSLVTGTLRRSVTVQGPVPLGTGRWSASVGPTAVYGRIQELGGVTGRGGATELPARPFVRPVYERLAASGALTALYSSAWRAAMNRH
jgi:phage gpG-like protein